MKCFNFAMLAFAFAAGGVTAYNSNRESLEWNNGYYQQRPDQFAVEVSPNLLPQQSQNLFFDKLGLTNSFQGSNQVGGNGWWGSISHKFPFITSLFSSRMEMPPGYGVPATTYGVPAPTYGVPAPTYGVPAPTYGVPPPTVYSVPPPQYFYSTRQFFPPGVQVTDDAVVVSAPGVPPFPAPVPVPTPIAPTPPVASGYDYSRPQYRLELPQKSNIK